MSLSSVNLDASRKIATDTVLQVNTASSISQRFNELLAALPLNRRVESTEENPIRFTFKLGDPSHLSFEPFLLALDPNNVTNDNTKFFLNKVGLAITQTCKYNVDISGKTILQMKKGNDHMHVFEFTIKYFSGTVSQPKVTVIPETASTSDKEYDNHIENGDKVLITQHNYENQLV